MQKLRSYSHCTSNTADNYKSGSVTVVFINLSNQTTLNIKSIDVSGVNALSNGGDRIEYILSSGASLSLAASDNDSERAILASRQVLLNGKLLQPSEAFEIPALNGKTVSNNVALTLKPLTYGFIEFPEANVNICF